MKKNATLATHLEALESRLVKLQMLERDCAYLKGFEGRSDVRAKRTNLILRIHAYLNWLFASRLIGAVDYGRLTRIFEKATKRAFWTSNATLWADDHPLVQELRLTWRWAQVKRRLKVCALYYSGVVAYG